MTKCEKFFRYNNVAILIILQDYIEKVYLNITSEIVLVNSK